MQQAIEDLIKKSEGNNQEALDSMIMLAKIYTYGMFGEPKDLEIAKSWLNKSQDLLKTLQENIDENVEVDNKPINPIVGVDNAFSDRFNNLDFSDNKIAKIAEKQDDSISSEPSREFDFDTDKINEQVKNIFIEKSITDEKIISTLRERISQYSNEIPHHDLKNFGNKIEIISVIEKPSYKLSLRTHYERRELKDGIRPYRGETIGVKLINKSNVEIWSFTGATPEIKEFEEKQELYTIVNSQEVHRCSNCKGQGEVTCYSCHGRGEVKCSTCGGTGRIRCGSFLGCSGKGYKEKTEYSNGRSYTKKETCSYCGGRGYTDCSCGNGWVVCSRCRGSGRLTCDICDGQGEIIEFLYFNDVFQSPTKTEEVNNPSLPQDIISGNSIYIYGLLDSIKSDNSDEKSERQNIHWDGTNYLDEAQFKQDNPLGYDAWKNNTKGFTLPLENVIKTEEKISNQYGKIIFEFKNKLIPDAILEATLHVSVKSTFEKLLSASKNASEFGVFEKDYKILKQKLIIKQINVIYVEYTFANKNYSLWIYGKDNTFLYIKDSPIQEIHDNYLSQSKDLLENKEYYRALELADKCLLMNPKDKNVSMLKKTITTKIKGQYLLGGLIGGLFFVPEIIYLIVDDKNMMTYENLIAFPISILIGFIIGLISSEIHSTKIKKSLYRWIVPIIYSFCISAIIIFTSFATNGIAYYIDWFNYTNNKYNEVVKLISNNKFERLSQVEIFERAVNEWRNNRTSENLQKAKETFFLYSDIRSKTKDNMFLEAVAKWKNGDIKTANKLLKAIKQEYNNPQTFKTPELAVELIESEMPKTKTKKKMI